MFYNWHFISITSILFFQGVFLLSLWSHCFTWFGEGWGAAPAGLTVVRVFSFSTLHVVDSWLSWYEWHSSHSILRIFVHSFKWSELYTVLKLQDILFLFSHFTSGTFHLLIVVEYYHCSLVNVIYTTFCSPCK